MKITSDNFVVFCDKKYTEAAERLIQILTANSERILDFFKLNQNNIKVNIYIYSTIDEYISHIKQCNQQYYDWMIADTFDGNINIVSIDICQKINSHKSISLNDYSKLIIHEFVHICQQAVNPDCNGCIWFWEALATSLSGQMFESPKELCSKEDLLFNYTELPDAYSISYFLGQYMLKNMTHDKIFEYIKNPESLRSDVDEILRAVLN